MSKKCRPSKENLERLYLTERKSTYQMAKELSVCQETARQWLISYDIPIRGNVESLTTNTKMPAREWMEQKYLVECKTARMIGEDLGVPTITVISWLKRYDIPRRTSYESLRKSGGKLGGWNKGLNIGGRPRINVPDKDELYNYYINERKSTVEIAEQYNVSCPTVLRWLKGHKIEVRDYCEARKVNGRHLDSEWLKIQYVENKKSTLDIAHGEGVSKKTILRALKEAGIPIRNTSQALRGNPKRSGKNNPAWKGGLSPRTKQLRYSAEYLEACRLVRKRDKACLICKEKGIDTTGKEHEVHHIDPIFFAPLLVFDIGNMILLCVDCHLSIRSKEQRWKRRLLDLVKKSALDRSPATQ